ncbi:MAG: hypothetical protein GY790_21720 [Bacteroidetes bacterium]|nr:hypothetical protein [Bacteroidota bacterium]
MLRGDPSYSLKEPFTCVISQKVAGVYVDYPGNSHIQPDILVSMSTAEYLYNDRQKLNWGEGTVAYYLLLPGNQSKEDLEAKFPALIEEVFEEGASENIRYWLQPLFDTHLKSELRFDFEAPGNLTTVYVFSIVALFILIASLGILGLESYSVEQPRREIGIRKVAGSSVGLIVRLISREFLILVLVSNVVAWPVAWYFMHNWLMDFPFRVKLGIPIFLLAGLLAVLLAMVTVISQGWRQPR